ncbi:MAG: hypothetical protein WC348_04740 [Patescibacteria group bacterium]|jgi:flagellar biosynthesis chaperone FliJ
MREKLSEREIISEAELSRLRQELEAAEAELAKVEEEYGQIVSDLAAGKENAAKKFNDYLERLEKSEQKAFAALKVWGDAAAKFHNLKD